ncbi:MAG: FAD:protein FMN transferase, partial [Burkholderiales bacterium]|nr:FAD:protein FMN transferase [Burkholderiales bacterium]
VSAINAAAGAHEVAIDAETAALLRYADQCHRLSGGRFDVTSGVLRRAWNFRAAEPRLPAQSEIDALLPLIGWQDVAFDARSVRLPRAGMEIDFGGIGKEYAADRAATILAERGVAHALVNLGGDVRAIGGQADGAPWRIGIRHPRDALPGAIASVELRDGAVATSGDYQRYFEIDGVRYCHVLDPRTGRPVHRWQSMSVVAPLAIVAGSCSTIAMLMQDEAPAFLASQGVAWLGVDDHGNVHDTLKA